jgi:Type IV secretory system Conjugative DNA transfer
MAAGTRRHRQEHLGSNPLSSARRALVSGGDRHLATFGPNGSGKSRRLLWPNLAGLLDWSMLVIDPKGELARDTAGFRAHHRSNVILLNPFNALNLGTATYSCLLCSHRFCRGPRRAYMRLLTRRIEKRAASPRSLHLSGLASRRGRGGEIGRRNLAHQGAQPGCAFFAKGGRKLPLRLLPALARRPKPFEARLR